MIPVIALANCLAGGAATAAQEFADRLAGCWRQADGATTEIWENTGLGLLFGYSLTVRDGVLTAFEDLRIESTPAGVVYIASPDGKTPVRFTAIEWSRDIAVFENPDHDFPQRIAYRIAGDNLVATISRLDGEGAVDFVMARCATR